MPAQGHFVRVATVFRKIVLHLATAGTIYIGSTFISDDPTTAMAAFFAATNPPIAQRFGVRRVEMPATAFRAFDAAFIVLGTIFAHARLLR